MSQAGCRVWALRVSVTLFFMLAASAAPAGTVDRVAARINGEILTESDVRKHLRENGSASLTPETAGSLLDRTLLLQEARRQKISVPENELERRVEETVRDLRGKYPSEKEFLKALSDEGMNLEEFKAELLRRLRTDHQVFQAVTAGTMVSEEEVRRFEQSRLAEGRSPVSLRLRRLGVPARKGQEAAACERVRELVRRINVEGLSFEDGVRRYSAVPGAKEDGGDLGWIELSRLSPRVAEATRDLRPGQASAPVVAGGYANVFYVEGKREGKIHLLEERFRQQREALLERLRAQAHIEIYSERLSRALPKEYQERAVVRVGKTEAVSVPAARPADPQPQMTPVAELTPTPRPKRSFFSHFRKKPE